SGEVWRPSDVSEPTLQPMTLREGLAQSKNTITAQVVDRVGPPRVAQLAQAMGVRDSQLDPVHALGLGTSPVTLREMVAAYGTIANGGQYVAPLAVLRVEDRNGRVIESFQPAAPEPALSPVANLMLLEALRAAVDSGTGGAIRSRFGLQGELAGKTGTTQNNTDGWFVLVHPQLVTGAWVGFNDNRITMHDSWGAGARSALPVVGDFMQQTTRARLVDARPRFGRPSQDVLDQANQGWGGLFPPLQAPAPSGSDPTIVRSQPGDPNPYPQVVAPSGAEPAIVVAPQRTSPPPFIVVAPPRATPERAIVVAPPRPPGQASGAGPAIVVPAPNAY
ncbi:MAG TPA: penicillin-binding transpeptidase domain-containing protein, partial [Ramlibacter sp.]|nr:penicillin-binding transpeptidase domain-containing protein [Ramlibacter sp.]